MAGTQFPEKGEIKLVIPKDCKICGSDRIDVNRMQLGRTKITAWAFCRNCGHRGKEVTGKFDVDESRDKAIEEWNKGE